MLYISYKVLVNIIALVTDRNDKWGVDRVVWQTDGPDKPTAIIVWQTDGPEQPTAILCDRRTDRTTNRHIVWETDGAEQTTTIIVW